MMIEYLEWDSNFFNKKIGRLFVNDDSEFDEVKFKEEASQFFDIVYVFSLQKLLSPIKVLSANLDMVDIIVTMSMPLNQENYKDLNYNFKTDLNNDEIIKCYEIAEQTSIVSRFYKDPLIGPEKSRALYRKWIDNAINHSFSDGFFLEKINNEVVGIHLIKTLVEEKRGIFTLTGIDSNYKRMGLGSKIWKQSLAYWVSIGNIEVVNSPFSFQNKESLNFHLKMGFNKIEEIKYIYHYRKHN